MNEINSINSKQHTQNEMLKNCLRDKMQLLTLFFFFRKSYCASSISVDINIYSVETISFLKVLQSDKLSGDGQIFHGLTIFDFINNEKVTFFSVRTSPNSSHFPRQVKIVCFPSISR